MSGRENKKYPYAVLQLIIDKNPDADESLIRDQFLSEVNDDVVLQRAVFDAFHDVLKELEAEHAAKPARGFDLDYVTRGGSKPKRYGRPKPN